MAIVNQIKIYAKKDKASELKKKLNSLVELALENKACQKFELYQLEDKRENLFIIEIWKNDKKKVAFYESEAYENLHVEMKNLIENEEIDSLKLPTCLTKLGLK